VTASGSPAQPQVEISDHHELPSAAFLFQRVMATFGLPAFVVVADPLEKSSESGRDIDSVRMRQAPPAPADSHAQFGSGVPPCDDKTSAHPHFLKRPAVARFFSQECARLSIIGREGSRQCRILLPCLELLQAQQNDIENMQKRELWKEQFASPARGNRLHGSNSQQASSDAESRQIRCGACRGISPLFDSLLPIALGVTRKKRDQTTALMPNVGVVFTVGGPLVYEEGGQSVSMSEGTFGHAFIGDYTAE
jgi:hypothetical protein